jgi:hypothetical protein
VRLGNCGILSVSKVDTFSTVECILNCLAVVCLCIRKSKLLLLVLEMLGVLEFVIVCNFRLNLRIIRQENWIILPEVSLIFHTMQSLMNIEKYIVI